MWFRNRAHLCHEGRDLRPRGLPSALTLLYDIQGTEAAHELARIPRSATTSSKASNTPHFPPKKRDPFAPRVGRKEVQPHCQA